MTRRYTDISECHELAKGGDVLGFCTGTRSLPGTGSVDVMYGFGPREVDKRVDKQIYVPARSILKRNGMRYELKIEQRRQHELYGDKYFNFYGAEAFLIGSNPKVDFDGLPGKILADVEIRLVELSLLPDDEKENLDFIVESIGPVSASLNEQLGRALVGGQPL